MSGSQGTAEQPGLSLELPVLNSDQISHESPRKRGDPSDDDIAYYGNTDDDNDRSRSSSSSSGGGGDSSPEHGPNFSTNNNSKLRPKTAPADVILSRDSTPPDHIYVAKRRPRRHSNNVNAPPIRIKVGRNCENPAARIVFKKLLPVGPAPGANIGFTTTIINTFGDNTILSPDNNNPPRPHALDITETRVFSNEDPAPGTITTTTGSAPAAGQNFLPSLKTSLSTPSPSPSPNCKKRASTSLCIFDEPSGYQMFERSQSPSPTPAQRAKTATGATSTSWVPPPSNCSPPVLQTALRNDTALLFNSHIPNIELVSNNNRITENKPIQRPSTSPLQAPPMHVSASEGSPLSRNAHLTSPTGALGRRSPGIASLRRNPKPYRGRRHTVGVAAASDDNDMGGTRMIEPGLSRSRPPTLFESPVPDLAPPQDTMLPEDPGSLDQLPLSPQSPSRTPSKRKRQEEENDEDVDMDIESPKRPVLVCSNKILNETADRLERTLSFANFEKDTTASGNQTHSVPAHNEESHPPKRIKTMMMGGALARKSNSTSSAITTSNNYRNSQKLINVPRLASIPLLLPLQLPPPSSPPTPVVLQPQTPQGIVLKPWQHNAIFGHSSGSGGSSGGAGPTSTSTDLYTPSLPHLSQFLVPRHMSSPLGKPPTDVSVSLNGSSPLSSNQTSEGRTQQQPKEQQEDSDQIMTPPVGPYMTPQQQQPPFKQFLTPPVIQGSPDLEALVVATAASLKAISDTPLEKHLLDSSIEQDQPTNVPAKNKNPKYRVGLSKYAPVDSLHGYLRK
ncbi:uncharacterized protein SAPINGB_P001119 [Magnusiomyces paraingens]|uniref:Uncharacterized protein n=1 Tax=Magnusiomyces paraingens TaxID=2606893 RepID=A0A5E8B448_9ASCO|nr:uncharacterized protein SAPINGB_P001119 [Saprochaete ingens]VVT46247.1 unnamed protein product [Saprochaete ingens]